MKARFVFILIAAVIIAIPLTADERSGPVGKMTVSAAAVDWQSSGSFDRLVLVVATPDGSAITREFAGNRATFRPQDLAPHVVADGTYVYELRGIPKISADVRQRLAAARAANDDDAVSRIRAEAGIGEPVIQAGAFTIHNGTFVTDAVEPPAPGGKLKATANATGAPKLTPGANDVVTADDEIIQGSLCVGLDCVVNESFGFDTIRLKENNTRIKFDDTSTSAGFPNNDWQLTANDSASGGANKFSIEDITGAKVPFTITAGAPTNSLFVASSGKVGLGNSAPVLNVHITATDTPAIRQEQTNGGGFTAQTWDIGANEANWFVRDVTGGSRLPLRIRPGAPTSSIDISATGQVGIGTASPGFPLDVNATTNTPLRVNSTQNPGLIMAVSGTTKFLFGVATSGGNFISGSAVNDVAFRADGGGKLLFSTSATGATNGLTINGTNVGIGTSNPTAQLMIVNGGSSSSANAGDTQFTAVSSRTFKENIEPVKAKNILDQIENIPVVTYDFRNGGPKDRMGLIAEDFHQIFGRGDDKHINGQEVQMALWLAVQQLTEKNKELTDRLATLEKQLSSQEKTQQ
jgi:hypothetical protein